MYEGGYSHAPDDLSYGVDMKKIRWCGILQVSVHPNNKKLPPSYVSIGTKFEFISLLHIGSSENSFGVLRGCSDRGIHHKSKAYHSPVWSLCHFRCVSMAMVNNFSSSS